VVAVSPYFSQVQLITDERAGAGARLKTSRTLGEIRGTNGPFPELRNISNLEEIQPGDEVITSGLDGIYPQGLLIGKVLSAQKRTDDVTQKILIQPAAHLSGFEEVMILQVDPNELHAQIQEALAPATPTTKGEKKPAAKTAGKASTKPTGEKKTDAGKKPDIKKKNN
jgi:rod shape-determining protein MreC